MPRPKPEVTEKMLQQLEEMSRVGLNMDQMSALIGVSPSTLDRMKHDNDDVSDAIEKGRARALIEVGKSAYQQAVSGKVPAMTMFYLKCRGGWKETHALEHSGPNGKAIETKNVSELSYEEVLQQIQAYLPKLNQPEKEEG